MDISQIQGRPTTRKDLSLFEKLTGAGKHLAQRNSHKVDQTDHCMRIRLHPNEPWQTKHEYSGDVKEDFAAIRAQHSDAILQVRITARDSVSGVGRSFSRDYDLRREESLMLGRYFHGDSLEVDKWVNESTV